MKNDFSVSSSQLSELHGYHLFLQYDIDDYNGSGQKAYLHQRALDQLNIAKNALRKISTPENIYELLIWDAHRTKETQYHIYKKYAMDISTQENISFEEAYPKALAFVNPPDKVFPHGTGGTVDLTLSINGKPANMGTDFDEFVEQSHKDWYRNNQPTNEFEREAHKNREILRSAMEHAGFYGLDFEWWHYEWGTKLWGEASGQKEILNKVIVDHIVRPHSPAYKRQDADRLPVLYSGVAQLFHSSRDRSAALSGSSSDHYYSRKSHPTVDGLGRFLSENIVKANHICLVSSGFNAAKIALLSAMESGGILVFDRRSYYEIGNEVGVLAKELGWRVEYADFTDIKAVDRQLKSFGKSDSIILYFDSPMNWWLDTIDFEAVGSLRQKYRATVLVDITLGPIQKNILRHIDVAIMSLSKYPSTGFTLGGAVYTNSEWLYSTIEATIGRFGSRMTVDSAMTIWSQAVTLIDRFSALSAKSLKIAEELSCSTLIRQVRIVHADDPSLSGGVIVLEFKSKFHAASFEKVIAQNTMNRFANLNLAYTFGGVMTTIEHFASNPRPSKMSSELMPLPDEFVRIGIGYEPVEDLLLELKTALSYIDSKFKS